MFKLRLKPVSNQADLQMNIVIRDKQTGELLDLTGANPGLTWRFEAWPVGARYAQQPYLTGSTDTGELTVTGPGTLQIFFPVGVMQSIEPGSYKMQLIVFDGTFTRAIYVGLLPVVGMAQLNYGYGA